MNWEKVKALFCHVLARSVGVCVASAGLTDAIKLGFVEVAISSSSDSSWLATVMTVRLSLLNLENGGGGDTPKVMYAILHRKCEMGPFLQSYPKRAFANPMAFFCTTCWPREKLILLLLRLWNGSLQKSSTRKNAANRDIVSQIARL